MKPVGPLNGKEIPLMITNQTIEIYDTLVSRLNKQHGNLLRGDQLHKAVIVSCVYEAYKQCGIPQVPQALQKRFGMNKRVLSKGIKFINKYADQTNKSNITVEDLILLFSQNITETINKIDEITKLYNLAKITNKEIGKNKPQNIAASVIFTWLKINGIKVSKSNFSKRVSVSEAIIGKIYKIIMQTIVI